MSSSTSGMGIPIESKGSQGPGILRESYCFLVVFGEPAEDAAWHVQMQELAADAAYGINQWICVHGGKKGKT